MADSHIGALPQATSVADDALLVMEQQGTAMKLTGAQLKRYAKQGVELEFQEYLDQAQAAADSAAGAVSAVTDMTVEAHASETATVAKTMKDGKVDLSFGLPQGAQGVPGPQGEPGQRGPQGAPGTGLKILGYYDTLDALKAAVPSPNVGDAYGIGTEAPYNIYVFDSVTLAWKDNGQLSGGGGGGPLPENVVTSEGGAEMGFAAAFGDAPHMVEFTDEEEPPLTAEDVQYSDSQNVKQAIDGLFTSVSDGKALVASAITDKGVPTAQDATFAQMAENIGEISGGSDTSDATATSFDILAPKTAYTAAGKVEGTIPSLAAQTITPGTADKTIANGQYLSGTQTIKGDANLTSGNIKKGVTLFGVEGALETSFKATLTVTADAGAVVTATHSGGTKVEALSTTGTVVLELPLEGTWSVTAVRGVAQYNTVTLNVSSQYSAALTAEVHIEYYGTGVDLSVWRSYLAAVSIGDYALFGGGYAEGYASGSNGPSNAIDAYNSQYTHTIPARLGAVRSGLAAAVTGNYALFGGGYSSSSVSSDHVDAYNQSLTKSTASSLSIARRNLVAASVGNHALFGGGYSSGTYAEHSTVDAYDDTLTRTTPTPLAIQAYDLAADSNANYAIFAGGYSGSQYRNQVSAYDKNLTRSTPTLLPVSRCRLSATRAGNYVVFAGGSKDGRLSSEKQTDCVDAYDLFLTRTTPENLSSARYDMAAACVQGFALFGGGTAHSSSPYSQIDVYDPYLIHTTTSSLSERRSNFSATTTGNSVLFSGGQKSSGASGAVDIYRYV